MDSEFQEKLYAGLMRLVESNEAFYYKDFEKAGVIYRIFNYRLASYTDFLEPYALECRGVMYEMNGDHPDRIAALPLKKFFNLNENPMVTGMDLSKVIELSDKMDGSLISSYIHFQHIGSLLFLKSKGSVSSEHCKSAYAWLNKPENLELAMNIKTLTNGGYTVNMEWCSPEYPYRIVIGYDKPQLKILCLRDMISGKCYGKNSKIVQAYPKIQEAWTHTFLPDNPEEFIENIPNLENVEGYVALLPDELCVKIKTNWYLTRHYNKDSVNCPRRLFEAVLNEATDDLRSLFYDDSASLQLIDEMEQRVEKIYNHCIDTVERFYERNKHLERKDYAILGQKELSGLLFPLGMSYYLGFKVDWKDWMKRHWKDFGIKDEAIKNDDN